MHRTLRRKIATATIGLVTAAAPVLVVTAPAAHAATTPILSLGDASVYEGDTGGVRTITLAITLAEPAATNVTFDSTLVAGTATAGTDHIEPRSVVKTMTIKAGQVQGVHHLGTRLGGRSPS